MLLTRFIQYLRGYLVITVTGKYPERFFNVCAGRHILIWNLFSCSQTVFKCCISNRAFRMLPPIVKKTGVQIKIVKKCGLPTVVKKLKKRQWFLAGLSVFFLLLIFLNQFVWKIELTGCETVPAGKVREVLSECGLKVGTFRPFLDEKKLQNQVLIKMPELTWMWADKRGSKVIVQVKERVKKPELFDNSIFCNIQAEKDGVIDSMIVRSGTPMVSLGDTVRAGDMLVSGLILSEKGVEPRKVHSDAEIYARVWYEKTKAFSLWNKTVHESGRKQHKYTLHIFGLNLNLFFSEKPEFAEFTEETKEFELSLFKRYFGIGFTKRTYLETVTSYEKMTPESMAQSGALEIEAMFEEMAASDGVKKNSQMSFNVLDEDTIEVSVVAEYIEDIAKSIQIEPT